MCLLVDSPLNWTVLLCRLEYKHSEAALCYVTGAQCARKNRSVSVPACTFFMGSFLHIEHGSNIFLSQKVVHFGPFSPKVAAHSSPNLLKE